LGNSSKNADLVEVFDTVAYSPIGNIRNELEGGFVVRELLLVADMGEMIGNFFFGDLFKIEDLATRNDGVGDLLDFGGGEDEADVSFGFFNGFEERIESSLGEHMDLVNDINFLFERSGGIEGFVEDFFSDIVYSRMRGGVDFHVIQGSTFTDGEAIGTLVAGVSVVEIEAIDSFGENSGGRCFSCASGSSQKIILKTITIGLHFRFENVDDVMLPYHLIKGLRTIFVGEGEGGSHWGIGLQKIKSKITEDLLPYCICCYKLTDLGEVFNLN
jgi:hypothetical protein